MKKYLLKSQVCNFCTENIVFMLFGLFYLTDDFYEGFQIDILTLISVILSGFSSIIVNIKIKHLHVYNNILI